MNSNVEISYKTVKDGYPIRLWKAVVDVNATPADVLRRFVKERYDVVFVCMHIFIFIFNHVHIYVHNNL